VAAHDQDSKAGDPVPSPLASKAVRRKTMRSAAAKAYLDGFGTVRSVIELDRLTAGEILTSVDPEWESGPTLNPWKRGYRAAIRAAFGW